MKAIVYFGLLISIISCTALENKQTEAKPDTVLVKAPTIAEERENPSKKPIAAYIVPVDDGMGNANNWKFAVNIYETSKTFEYKVQIQYKELRATEKISIPNFGIIPVVSIKPGKSNLDCIIGFEDKQGLFKDYIQVNVKNEQLKFKKINSYAVVKYSTPIK
ncbi:hypothetical protein [Sediminibacterium sp.]|uniref:hypothetical protein n=1 Tax=Sediminibacterium sp. TaxID=1917865 RepID=UPI0025FEB9BE|nr:hypothetical protein [Sediminibacterium sp.]MBT9484036.1 hypothetical protein [Sediminibacterium sp.]